MFNKHTVPTFCRRIKQYSVISLTPFTFGGGFTVHQSPVYALRSNVRTVDWFTSTHTSGKMHEFQLRLICECRAYSYTILYERICMNVSSSFLPSYYNFIFFSLKGRNINALRKMAYFKMKSNAISFTCAKMVFRPKNSAQTDWFLIRSIGR